MDQIYRVRIYIICKCAYISMYFPIRCIFQGTLPDGQRILVKRLGLTSKDVSKNEIEVLSKLQHRNVVRLLDSAVKGDETLVVYEFLPKSLDRCIFGIN